MDISAGGSFGRMLGARNILPRSEMWQMGFENMMQSESHKERVSIYVTRQLGQKELTAGSWHRHTQVVPEALRKGFGSMNVVDFGESLKCPAFCWS